MKYFRERYIEKEREKRGLYRFFRASKKDPLRLNVICKRIGLHEAEEFRKELTDYLERHKGTIVLNTSQLDDLDCAGVAAIVMAERTARRMGKYLILKGLRGKAQVTLKITGLDELLTNSRLITK